MKKLILLLLIFSSFRAFSQELIELNKKIFYQNDVIYSLNLIGYNTHFNDVDTNIICFYSNSDTLKIINTPASSTTNSNLRINVNNSFDSTGIYSILLINDIDDSLHLPNTLQVLEEKQNYAYFINKIHKKQYSSSNIDLHFTGGYSHFNDAIIDYAIFTNFHDTIFVNSINAINNEHLSVNLNIPNDAAGFYHLIYHNPIDGYLSIENTLYVDNTNKIQINTITPDSIDNINFFGDTLYINGNNTSFTVDSKVHYLNLQYPECYDCFDLIVINDTFIKAVIYLPIIVKSAISPNSILSIYNPTDGLLKYPLRIDFYGGINDLSEFNNINLYPNPSSNVLNIESEEFQNQEIEIKIFSIESKLINTFSFSNKTSYRLNISNLKKGIYLIDIESDNHKNVFKFIKQ